MIILAEKVIAHLKSDATLVTLLGGSYISSMAIQDKVASNLNVFVSTNAGSDMNSVPVDIGTIDIIISVNRSIEQAATKCYTIAKRIDLLINRSELSLSDTTYKLLNITRSDSSGLQVSDYQQELFYSLSYSYLLENDN